MILVHQKLNHKQLHHKCHIFLGNAEQIHNANQNDFPLQVI